MPTTILVGGGTSALAYAATCEKDMTVLGYGGGKDVWRGVEAHHRMGQPAPMLRGNLIPGDKEKATATGNPGGRPKVGNLVGFMTAEEFLGGLKSVLGNTSRVYLSEDWVMKIGMRISPYVTLKRGDLELAADRVVLATGPGQSNPLTTIREDGATGTVVEPSPDGRIIGGEFLAGPSKCELAGSKTPGWVVVIYGGSATAAWAAEAAMLRGYHVLSWGTRIARDRQSNEVEKDPSKNAPEARFAEAFPAGDRNFAVQHRLAEKRRVYDTTRVEFNPNTGLLTIWVRYPDGKTGLFVADQLVYALGSSNKPVFGRLFDESLAKTFVPLYDDNGTINDKHPLLGFGTPDKKIVILGAGVHNSDQALVNQKIDQTRAYKTIANTLPKAAAPPEGIAIIMASIEAFNNYMPAKGAGGAGGGTHFERIKWDINLNTANRTQLAAWLASTVDMEESPANLAVALIVTLRAKTTFGLSRKSVGLILEYCQDYHRRNPGFLRAMRPDYVDILAEYLAQSEILRTAMMTRDDQDDFAKSAPRR
jgi:hypothetical protein